MSIILNEYEWAEQMEANHDLGQNPFETLRRVAKYYYANQYSKRTIRQMLDTFLLQCDPSASLSKWSDTLDKIAKNVGKFPLVKADSIEVSEKELERISVLGGIQQKRLAFTLLCAAKYCDIEYPNNDHWVKISDKEIMKMANIGTSIKRQSLLFHQLREEGMIRFSRQIDNLNVRVMFIEASKVAIHIHDFRNLGYQYMKYIGGPYFECENCGITEKKNHNKGRPQKYCQICASKIKTLQSIDSVMRHRAQQSN